MDVIATLYGTRGAVSAVAEKIGVSVPAVSQWRRRGIPADRLPAVESALRAHLAEIGLGADVGTTAQQIANHNGENA